MKNVLVGQSGGPTAVINSSLAGVYETAKACGAPHVYGMQYGIEGVLEGKLIDLDTVLGDKMDIELLKRTPSSFLGSCRHKLPDPSVDEKPFVQLFELFRQNDIGAVFYIGGNDSMDTISKLSAYGKTVNSEIRFIGVPKTIDNDLPCTERTFGFDTAMAMATEALDRLHTTAESHHRVMVLEVMGRYAGWIALHSGIAGGADVILLPEIPYKLEPVIAKIQARKAAGKNFSIVVVAEGARPEGGEMSIARMVEGSFEPIRLGGAGEKVAQAIEEQTGIESRCTVLGYLQRGGSPTAFDRVLSTRYGVAAAEACLRREYNVMVSLYHDQILTVFIQKAASKPRQVPVDSEIIRTGRQLGLCFGD